MNYEFIKTGLDDYILKCTDKDNKYQISNLEFTEDGIMNTTGYFYSVLQNSFLKIGIDDLNYIYNRICELYQRYKEEQEKNDK